MAEEAGTPEVKAGESVAPTPAETTEGSEQVSVSKQFKKEALENWKPAAEERNRLRAELEAERAKSDQLARLAYGGGQQATDPDAEAYRQVAQQAEYDPVARVTMRNTERTVMAEAEAWLAKQMIDVPKEKRNNVETLIRNAGFKLNASQALKVLEDPETRTLSDRLAETEAELARLKNSKPNAVSPSSVTPANSSVDDGATRTTMKMSEYVETLKSGGPRATELMKAVGSGKTKLERE